MYVQSLTTITTDSNLVRIEANYTHFFEVTTKKGTLAEKVDVKIFDDTSEANFTLWGWVCSSASAWKPSRTLLLISRPSFKVDRVLMVNMTSNTFVEVDPLMRDAIWLRSFAQKLTKREHVNPEIPDDGLVAVCMHGLC